MVREEAMSTEHHAQKVKDAVDALNAAIRDATEADPKLRFEIDYFTHQTMQAAHPVTVVRCEVSRIL